MVIEALISRECAPEPATVADRYDFANLSPIEFESLSADLVSAETDLRFERFSEGADGGVDGRHSRSDGDIILQAKHYKNSTWSDLQRAAKHEAANVAALNPTSYYFLTSQPLTRIRKAKLVSLLGHPSVTPANIWGRTELNTYLAKHGEVERRNIKLWLSSAAVLQRLLKNDIAVFTEATQDEIERILKVFVANPSLAKSASILKSTHCLIVSGPPGVGKTTLAQVLAAEYSDEGWELVAVASIADAFRAFRNEGGRQVFVFDDFLGKIRLDPVSLARDDGRIVRLMSMVRRNKDKRFILTTRAYILQAARLISEAIDDDSVDVSEMVLNLATYTRELKARILYNHLYHSALQQPSIQALLKGETVQKIVDHRNYMPRIIQWMTDELRQREVAPDDYPRLFLQTLESPNKIWEKAFRQHISLKARVLLYCMYFSENEGLSDPGIRIERLRIFFDRAVVAFGSVAKEELRASMFEETLREIKSSFVTIDGAKVNFINPSVQDFLSRETADDTVLATLAKCVPTLAAAASLWRTAKMARGAAQTANGILGCLVGGQMDGRTALTSLGELVGDLVLTSGELGYLERLRQREVEKHFWIDETDLPVFLDLLNEGRFSSLPHARSFGRYLRRKLYGYVSEREYVLEIEELAKLATSLSAAHLEMSQDFYKAFDEAVEESLDALDMDKIPRDEDPEQVIGEWLDHINSIESITSTGVSSVTKSRFEDRITSIQRDQEMRRQWEYDQEPSRRSHSQTPRPAVEGVFSNVDLRSMFSSLKK
jgi:hypothetical protein